MKTETFTFRDPQVEAVRFPADESLQKQVEQHFNGQIKGTSLPPVERVCEFRDLAGSEITAGVGDIITKSISGGIRVYDQNTFDTTFQRGTMDDYIASITPDPGHGHPSALRRTTATNPGLDFNDEDGAHVVNAQLTDLMEGIGATEDHEDCRAALAKGNLTKKTIDAIFQRIIPTSDWHKAGRGQEDGSTVHHHSVTPMVTMGGPLRPMGPDAARSLAVAMANVYRPKYWAEDFVPHTWVVAAVIEASTAPQFQMRDGSTSVNFEVIAAGPDLDKVAGRHGLVRKSFPNVEAPHLLYNESDHNFRLRVIEKLRDELAAPNRAGIFHHGV